MYTGGESVKFEKLGHKNAIKHKNRFSRNPNYSLQKNLTKKNIKDSPHPRGSLNFKYWSHLIVPGAE
jgi:hypothetical protein